MRQALGLSALFVTLVLVVWIAVRLEGPKQAQAPARSADRPTAQATGEVELAEVGAVASRNEHAAPAPQPVAEEGVARVAEVDEPGTVSERTVVPTRICAVANDFGGRALARRELELGWRGLEQTNDTPQPLAIARTTEDGAVEFEIDAEALADMPISLRVKDTHSGTWAWCDDVVLSVGGERDLGTLVLALPRELHPEMLAGGRVVDDDFGPVPGVVGFVSAFTMFVDEVQLEGPSDRWEGEVLIEPTGHFAVYGPPTVEHISLVFAAKGYGEEDLFQVEVPNHGLEVFLAREIRLRGQLLVPEHGPPVTGYGVWLSEEGKGIGISPGRDGRFAALGSTRSLEVKVTQPGLGLVLFRQTFALSPEADGELGTIDVRDVVKPLDLVLVDSTGAAIANEVVWIEVKDVEPAASEPRGQAPTDTNGRLFVAVPTPALEAILTVSGRAPVVVDLVSPPPRIEVP